MRDPNKFRRVALPAFFGAVLVLLILSSFIASEVFVAVALILAAAVCCAVSYFLALPDCRQTPAQQRLPQMLPLLRAQIRRERVIFMKNFDAPIGAPLRKGRWVGRIAASRRDCLSNLSPHFRR